MKLLTKINIFLIIIFIITFVIFFVLNTKLNNKEKELELLKKTIHVQDNIKNIENKLSDMKIREQQYTNLENKKIKLLQAIDELEKRKSQLNKIKKERIQSDVENLTTNDLSLSFNNFGFPNTINSCE